MTDSARSKEQYCRPMIPPRHECGGLLAHLDEYLKFFFFPAASTHMMSLSESARNNGSSPYF